MTPAMGTGHKLSNAPSVTAGEETPEQRRARAAEDGPRHIQKELQRTSTAHPKELQKISTT
eukprot:gene21928-28974_t